MIIANDSPKTRNMNAPSVSFFHNVYF